MEAKPADAVVAEDLGLLNKACGWKTCIGSAASYRSWAEASRTVPPGVPKPFGDQDLRILERAVEGVERSVEADFQAT